MAKHLSKRDVDAIVNLIRGWSNNKLTWDAICKAAKPLVGKEPTRQSLNTHEAIAIAYKSAKASVKKGEPRNTRPPSLRVAADRIFNLERQIAELKEQNREYKQLFAIWQYNAYKYGLKEHQLNESLPKIDRERTDGSKR